MIGSAEYHPAVLRVMVAGLDALEAAMDRPAAPVKLELSVVLAYRSDEGFGITGRGSSFAAAASSLLQGIDKLLRVVQPEIYAGLAELAERPHLETVEGVDPDGIRYTLTFTQEAK